MGQATRKLLTVTYFVSWLHVFAIHQIPNLFFFRFFITVYLTAKTVPMLLLTSVSLFLCHKVCDNKIIIRKLKQRHFRYKYKCDSVKQLNHFWWPAVA